MKYSLTAMLIGFAMDCLIGDPHGFPHPVVGIGKLITVLHQTLRKRFPKTRNGEILAGGILWLVVSGVSFLLPAVILTFCYRLHRFAGVLAESVMCWQVLALKSLKDESMKVFFSLRKGDLLLARRNVSMIVGRDTEFLDADAVTRAAVETVAENTSDGVIAPLLFLAIGGAPLGFLYKAINTMDSMLGYTDPPYQNFGLISAKADDVANFIPARISACLMLVSGWLLRFNWKNGWKIFQRDRFAHASPNSAQTESVCAGLLGIRLAGNAVYHGILHHKPYIGDPLRNVEYEDIPRTCRLLYVTACLALILFAGLKFLIL